MDSEDDEIESDEVFGSYPKETRVLMHANSALDHT